MTSGQAKIKYLRELLAPAQFINWSIGLPGPQRAICSSPSSTTPPLPHTGRHERPPGAGLAPRRHRSLCRGVDSQCHHHHPGCHLQCAVEFHQLLLRFPPFKSRRRVGADALDCIVSFRDSLRTGYTAIQGLQRSGRNALWPSQERAATAMREPDANHTVQCFAHACS